MNTHTVATVDGDDISTDADPGGWPHVKVFDGSTAARLQGFFAYNVAFAGGFSVSAADVNGDGMSDIVTGAGSGFGEVRVFDVHTWRRFDSSSETNTCIQNS